MKALRRRLTAVDSDFDSDSDWVERGPLNKSMREKYSFRRVPTAIFEGTILRETWIDGAQIEMILTCLLVSSIDLRSAIFNPQSAARRLLVLDGLSTVRCLLQSKTEIHGHDARPWDQ